MQEAGAKSSGFRMFSGTNRWPAEHCLP